MQNLPEIIQNLRNRKTAHQAEHTRLTGVIKESYEKYGHTNTDWAKRDKNLYEARIAELDSIITILEATGAPAENRLFNIISSYESDTFSASELDLTPEEAQAIADELTQRLTEIVEEGGTMTCDGDVLASMLEDIRTGSES